MADLRVTHPRRDNDVHYEPMRGVLRTVEVLSALNVHNGATVVELMRATGISRPALYRLLETLRGAGYVAADSSQRHYMLTLKLRGLADGFTDDDLLVRLARPALRALQKITIYPVDLGTLIDNVTWIRVTTRPRSSLTIDRATVGSRVALLPSAAGRAYLAYCPNAERELILANIIRAREPDYESALDRPRLDALLELVRDRGYGWRYGEPPVETGAIAVAVRGADRVLGCIGMTFVRSALTPAEAADRCLPAMLQTAAELAADVEAEDRSPSDEVSSDTTP